MIQGPDARADRFLTDLAAITRRIERAQNQITSGRRLNQVSDAPDEVSRLLQIRAELSSTEQIHFNLGRVQTEVDSAEQALQHGVLLMDRVSVLAAQGANGTLGASERRSISVEVGTLLEQLGNLTGTAVEGRYLFSGDADQTVPYQLNLNLYNPFSAYQGSTSTRQVQHPSGQRFSVALTADQIFDDPTPGNSVFQAVNDLRQALAADDPAAINQAMTLVRSSSAHLNNQLAYYGTVQNQVREALDSSSSKELQLHQQISNIQDTDLASAILELNNAQLQQRATLSAEGQRSRETLFNYLR